MACAQAGPHGELRDPESPALTHGFLGRKDEEFDRKAFEERLNAVGAEGWEFDKLIPAMALHGEKDGHLLVFKREH